MIIIGAEMPNLAMDNLPVNWFDFTLVGMLIFGFFRGRKQGMSKEFLPVLKWISIVVGCGFGYPMAADLLTNVFQLTKTSSYILGYLLLAVIIWFVFKFFRWLLTSRMGERTFFGGSEYYLGMLAGMIRFICMVLAVLAVLNAPVYTAAEIKQHDAYVKRWFGGGMYSGDFFPSVYTVQGQVFNKSFLGPYIKDYLGPILIETGPPTAAEPKSDKKPAAAKSKK
jgi:uncharacterized membrane protein required for colicin V production